MRKVGIVGTGGFAAKHAQAWQEISGITAAGVFGSDKARREDFGRKFGIPCFESLDALFSRCDIVDVVTQNYLHPAQGMSAIRAGKHVLIEKPTALTHREALDLAVAADHAKVRHGTVHPLRYSHAVNAFWRVVESGIVGAPGRCVVEGSWPRPDSYYAENGGWRKTADKCGGGVLIHQFIHFLDLALWKFGGIDRVESCSMEGGDRGVEQAFTAKVRFANGVSGVLRGSSRKKVPGGKTFTVFGEKGSVSFSGNTVSLRPGGEEKAIVTEHPQACDPLWSLLTGFKEAVELNADFSPSLFEAADCMRAVEGLYAAGR